MNRYILFLFFLIIGGSARAQCLTNSLIINTGYNPITGLAIPGGANGATPVPDPHWILTAVSPGVATAIAGTPIPGLIEVIPGNKADVVTPIGGAWITNPVGNPGNWISCLNSNTYTDPGTGIPLNMTLGRPFRMCTADSIKLTFNISSDNYTSAANIDGTIILPAPATGFAAYTFYTQTVWLTAGTHTFNIEVVDLNVASPSSNPTGLNVYGTVSSATGTNSLVSEVYASCSTYACGSTCNTIALPDTLHICEHGTDTLRATVIGTDSVLSIAWTPITGLSSSTVLRPQITVGTTSGWYDITVQSLTPYNLVYNGDFSLGNTGFTSTYTYVSGPSSLVPEGTYAITTNPILDHPGAVSFGDHTTGTGNMMAINGASTATSVWCQTIPVTPNTDYTFSAWVANWSTADVGPGVPILQFMINGVLLGTPDAITSAPGVWVNFYATWNSGASTTATICIYDECTALNGNDFALDDISFQQICVAKDSIYVDVALVDTTYNHVNDSVCAPITSVTLTAPAGYSSYTWSTGVTTIAINVSAVGSYWVYAPGTCAMFIDTFIVSIAHVDTTYAHADSSACASVGSITLTAPAGYTSYTWSTGSTSISITVTTAGSYWVYAPSPCAMLIDTFHVVFNPLPVVNLGNDTGFCSGDSLILSSIQPAGNTYLWNTGSTLDTIHVSVSGTYWLQVNNGCVATDTIHILVTPLPVVNLGNDTIECQGLPLVLQSSVIYPGGFTYLWNTGATTPSITVTTSGTYWLQVSNGGCPGSDTIHVAILYDTVTLHTHDTAVCKGTLLQVFTTGNPVNTYQWIPTTGIANSTAGSPTIICDTSALYIMTAYYPGCPDIIDSFYLDVQPNPVHVYIGGNRAVCKFDTLHIHASVTPAWYTHYIYHWSPGINLDDSTATTVVFTAGDSTTIVLTVTTSAGCTGVDSAKIAVYPSIFAHVDSVYNLCPHDSVQFKPTGGVSYYWYPSIYIDSPTSSAPWVHAITSQDYTMVATSQYGCKDTLSVKVVIEPGAVIYLEDSVTIYPGESYQINPQTNCVNFMWYPSIGLNHVYISNPLATPDVNTKYIVYGSTEQGCKTVDSIIIYVDPETLLDLPNAFAPGNGPNNLFKIIKRGIATLNYFRIFNRWGNMVYESSDIDAGWDGTYKGQPQPFDVYVYEVEAVTNTGRVFYKHGNVTLVR
ncbi:MAG: gliding motility-associated C-terminal domain-containing protein [Chitinophagales bacterium]